MNIIYECQEYLPILTETSLLTSDLSAFFSTHKNSCVFVTDDLGVLKGYVNHALYKKDYEKKMVKVHSFAAVVEKRDLPYTNLGELFSSGISAEAIPVMENGLFLGAFLKNYSEELMAFDRLINKIALNTLQYFKKETACHLHSNFISTITFIGEEEDRRTLQESIKEVATVLSDGDCSSDIIIDSIHSRSYRESKKNGAKAVYSLEELMTIILIPVVRNYCASRGVDMLICEGPLAEKLYSAEIHGLVEDKMCKFEEVIASDAVCKKFSAGNSTIYNYLKDTSNGPLRDNYVTTNGLHLVMGIKSRENESDFKNNVHLYGSCLTYGMCVPEPFSISSLMKPKIAKLGYGVINHGVKNGHSLLNDFLYILNTPLKGNDRIIIINAFSSRVRESLQSAFEIKNLSETLNLNDNQNWYYLDNTFHVNHIANQIISDALCKSIVPGIYEPNQNLEKKSYLEGMLPNITLNNDRMCEEWVLGAYKEYLLAHKKIQENGKIGAVLLTANPITLGHEHLIGYAKAHCDILYVFIVEEDLFFFTTAERMLLAHLVLKDPNVIVVSTGSMMTAKFTFPEYFTKSTNHHPLSHEDIPDLHCEIFGKFVSPLLGITIRFVGEERKDSVTMAYNHKLQTLLPTYGIEVVEIPRLQTLDSTFISSSLVRKSIQLKKFGEIKHLVSEPVERYIKEKWNRKS